jgi:hypothetical protein
MNDEKILKRDEKLLKNEKSWRRARIGILIIAPIQILALYLTMLPSTIEEKVHIAPAIASSVFWLLVIDLLNLRLNHIDSIKLYRNKLNH